MTIVEKPLLILSLVFTTLGTIGWIRMNPSGGMGAIPILWMLILGIAGLIIWAIEYLTTRNSARNTEPITTIETITMVAIKTLKTAIYATIIFGSGFLGLIYFSAIISKGHLALDDTILFLVNAGIVVFCLWRIGRTWGAVADTQSTK